MSPKPKHRPVSEAFRRNADELRRQVSDPLDVSEAGRRRMTPPVGAILTPPSSGGLGLGALIRTSEPETDPIPELRSVPGRLKSWTIDAGFYDAKGSLGHVLDELTAKIRLEDDRMRRMLPPAPRGYHWRGELQVREEDEMGRPGHVLARIVYRLHDDETHDAVDAAVDARGVWRFGR